MTGKNANRAPCHRDSKNNLIPRGINKCMEMSGNVSPDLGTGRVDSMYRNDVERHYLSGPGKSEIHAVTEKDCLLVELDCPLLSPNPQNTSNMVVPTDGYLLREHLDWDMECDEFDNVSSFSSGNETSSDFLNLFETNGDNVAENLESGYSSSGSCSGTDMN